MDGQASQTEILRALRDKLGRGPVDDQQVGIICHLLSAVDLTQIDARTDGLPLVQMYLEGNRFPHMVILNQFAASGFFNIQDEHLRTPLHWIFTTLQWRCDRHLEAIKNIINYGGDPALADINGDTVLHVVLERNLGTAWVSAVLEGQPKPSPMVNARNKKGWTPMRIVVSRDAFLDVETLRLLFDFGGDINEIDEMGNSLMLIALSTQEPTHSQRYVRVIAEIFVGMGADVSLKNISNLVALRLAIDSEIPLIFLSPLIPSVDILNEDSCWDGPFIDFVLKNAISKYDGKFLTAALEAGATHVSKETLLMAIGSEDIEEKHLKLLLAKGCRVTLDVIHEVINRKRFDLLEIILMNADEELIKMTNVSPNISRLRNLVSMNV